jgi:hypothetical protein
LLRDRHSIYGEEFRSRVAGMGRDGQPSVS